LQDLSLALMVPNITMLFLINGAGHASYLQELVVRIYQAPLEGHGDDDSECRLSGPSKSDKDNRGICSEAARLRQLGA